MRGVKEMVMFSLNFGNKKFHEFRDAVSKSVNDVKEELNDHREAINQNTNEVQSVYEYLCRLDSKIDKLIERLDELSLFFNDMNAIKQKKINICELTRKEKEVFLVIYANDSITYKGIAKKLLLTENLVGCYITSLISKGVPLIKRYVNNEIYLYLDPEFKAMQTKENIVEISEVISSKIQM